MEDDDITDVTSMAGVNLIVWHLYTYFSLSVFPCLPLALCNPFMFMFQEESAQMAASVNNLSGMTRSVKDDSFLSADCLRQRVNEIGR